MEEAIAREQVPRDFQSQVEGVLPVAGREVAPCATVSRGHELLSADFLAQLERFALLSRRSLPRPREGRAAQSPQGHRASSSPTTAPYGVRRRPPLRRLEHLRPASTASTLSCSWTRRISACNLLLDASASMSFGEPSKLDYGARLAAALGRGRPRQPRARRRGRDARARGRGLEPGAGPQPGDAAHGLPVARVRPVGRHLAQRGAGRVARAHPGGRARRLISDLMDPGGYERGLKALLERRLRRARRSTCSAADEMNPVWGGDLRLEDAETGETARPHARRRRRCACTGSGCASFSRRAERLLPRATRSAITEW